MFSHKQYYSNRMESHPLLKLVDVFDKESFIREYVFDNIYVCIFMYILFYFATWYAHKVIKRIETKNQEMRAIVEKNRSRLDDIVALKNKRAEYEDIIIKTKGTQKITTKQLDSEIKRLNSEHDSTVQKLNDLEKFLGNWQLCKSGSDQSGRRIPTFMGISPDGIEALENQFEDVKVLEPSFPPAEPPEPPPRKFGVFARPPAPCTTSPKIGFKSGRCFPIWKNTNAVPEDRR